MMRGTREHAVRWAPDTAGMRSVLSLGSWLMLRTLSMRIASLLTVFVVALIRHRTPAAYQLGMGVFNLFLYALDSSPSPPRRYSARNSANATST